MPLAQIGQRVQVDISGLQAPGASFGSGASAMGTITGVDPIRGLIAVSLFISVGGSNVVTVPASRVTLLQ